MGGFRGNTLVSVFGRKGAGKTTLLQWAVYRHLVKYPGFRCIVYDSLGTGEWSAFRPDVDYPERLQVLSPLESDFEGACRAALAVSKKWGGCVLVHDEIAL